MPQRSHISLRAPLSDVEITTLTQLANGNALGHRLKLPVVATYQTLFEEYLHHYIRWLPQRWLRFIARRLSVHQCQQVDALVAPSRATQQALARYGITSPSEVIPTGLAVETFCHPQEDSDFRTHYHLPPEARVLLEAMALGTPVVSTAMMGTLDALKEGEGCLIAEDNYDNFATKDKLLLSDENHRLKLAERVQAYAASWHEDAKSAELVRLYEKLSVKGLASVNK